MSRLRFRATPTRHTRNLHIPHRACPSHAVALLNRTGKPIAALSFLQESSSQTLQDLQSGRLDRPSAELALESREVHIKQRHNRLRRSVIRIHHVATMLRARLASHVHYPSPESERTRNQDPATPVPDSE